MAVGPQKEINRRMERITRFGALIICILLQIVLA
jgi:hypothetical protein